MAKIPYLYQKILDMIQEQDHPNLSRAELEKRLSHRFRVSLSEIPKILDELEQNGFIRKKTQRRIKFDF